jgi:pimeloyl-ACP methyl ester carboxylesterase
MNTMGPRTSGVTTRNQFVEINERRIAYRSVGEGLPLILANRFRGIMDDWDPAFLDALAQHHQVIIFDYSGFGLSAGAPNSTILEFARDVKDLANALGLRKIVGGGWSFGGFVAQILATEYPELVSHTILIGTRPPGKNAYPIEQIFLDTAYKPVNTFEDEIILFFEPDSESSRQAAKRSHGRLAERTEDRSVPIPMLLLEYYGKGTADFEADKRGARERLATSRIPVLVISGDHEICFPPQNWFMLVDQIPTMQLIVIPQAGHGPQHQHPEMIASYITTFIQSTP